VRTAPPFKGTFTWHPKDTSPTTVTVVENEDGMYEVTLHVAGPYIRLRDAEDEATRIREGIDMAKSMSRLHG